MWKLNGEYIEDEEGRPIARLMGTHPYNREWGLKLAAADEMLDALRKAQAYLNQQYTEVGDVDLDLLNAVNYAVAKAVRDA